MKRILSVLMTILLLLGSAMPAAADSLMVTFTRDSRPQVGGKLEVDLGALLNNGNITAEEYNALLEKWVIFSWYKNDMLIQEGTYAADSHIYELNLHDLGCTFYAQVSIFEDDSFQNSKQISVIYSERVTIAAADPKITTVSLPEATVGKAYHVKLSCSDSDARFSEIMGSQLSEFGLYLTQHGEIEGTPTKAGNCHVNVLAMSEGGGEDSRSFDITVHAAPKVAVQITSQSLPEAVAGEYYCTKLTCSDGDASFGIAYNPGGSNEFEKTGLILTTRGDLEGVPQVAGQYTFTVYAAGVGGEDYRVFTLTVNPPKAAETTPSETTQPTEPVISEDTQPTESAPVLILPQPTEEQTQPAKEGIPMWVSAAILVVGIGIGVGVAVLVMKAKNRT